MNVDVVRAGFLTTVQDLGRIGSRQFGVSVGGALDVTALRVANLLVGNDEQAAGLEVTLGRSRLRFQDDRAVAWCGGEFDTNFPAGHVAKISAGTELVFGQTTSGCRAWLAISGGIDVPLVLGSRSTDLRGVFGGFHGRALRDGDAVPLGTPRKPNVASAWNVSPWSAPHAWSHTARSEPILRIVRGAEWEQFDRARSSLREIFTVTPDSNRMGVRLEGPEVVRNRDVDLLSEAVAPGTIQVPPSGKPIVLLGDCQTIGGYPKIAHVITVDLPVAAQLRPGDRVSFREVPLAEADRLLAQREHDFRCFKTGLSLRAP